MKKALIFLGLLIATTTTADEVISGGLTLTIPDLNATNWGALFRDDFATPISEHDHTGSGKGLQLGASSLQANAVTGAKFRLDNDQYLRARNFANSADLNLLKLDASNKIIFDVSNVDATTRTSLGAAASGANADITSIAAPGASNFEIDVPSGLILDWGGADRLLGSTIEFRPTTDDALSLGAGNYRYSDVYAVDVKANRYEPDQVTSDGSDNEVATIQGFTGTTNENRGAFIKLHGNESAGLNGLVEVNAGDASGAYVTIYAPNTTGSVRVSTNGGERWRYDASGNLVRNATSGGDLDMSGGGNIRYSVAAAVTAAGTVVGDATALSSRINFVTTATVNQGVVLPNADTGETFVVKNDSGATIRVYVPSGHSMTPVGTFSGASGVLELPDNYGVEFAKIGATTWIAW